MNLQIKMHARCGVSGKLKDWPRLQAALAELGHDLPGETLGIDARQLCQDLVCPDHDWTIGFPMGYGRRLKNCLKCHASRMFCAPLSEEETAEIAKLLEESHDHAS